MCRKSVNWKLEIEHSKLNLYIGIMACFVVVAVVVNSTYCNLHLPQFVHNPLTCVFIASAWFTQKLEMDILIILCTLVFCVFCLVC